MIYTCFRRIYWTNWDSHHPSIQRSFFRSIGVESIITTEIRMPNAITLDHKTQKLYWGDARLDKIERAEYDGSNRVVSAYRSTVSFFNLLQTIDTPVYVFIHYVCSES